ncbi:hypothetical protein CVT24_005658 [Panaeolus cyanescens]|uniref:Uncharacterized protein n=1 Tax=Panaeolus cyanescens TaxID=181874 RepID=A0A409V9J1_9AGAR|nr:hypothetical protein CVT24_005658 [Panaeolus cyanescens]
MSHPDSSDPMWDEPAFQACLDGNDCPADALASAIQERLRDPSAMLASMDAEIEDLQSRLKDVQTRRQELQASIASYQTVMSPIRRLSDDVLREIFVRCLSEFYPSLDGRSHAPLLLTHICKRWRNVAFTTPRLWVRLAVTLPPTNLLVSSISDEPGGTRQQVMTDARVVQHHLSNAKHQATAIERWMERSGALPLFIHIHHPNYFSTFNVYGQIPLHPQLKEILSTVFSALAPYSSRWRELHLITADSRVFLHFSTHLSSCKLGNLKTFTTTDLHPTSPEQWREILSTPLYKSLPSIRRFQGGLHLSMSESWPYDAHTWKKITRLDLTSALRVAETMSVFEKCPNLVHLQLRVCPDTRTRPPPDSRVIQMDKLKQLELHFEIDKHFNGFGPAFTSSSVFTISAPKLKHLTYLNDLTYYSTMLGSSASADSSLNFPLKGILGEADAIDELQATPSTQAACDDLKAILLDEGRHLSALCIGTVEYRSRSDYTKYTISNVDRAFQTLCKVPEWFPVEEANNRPLSDIKELDKDLLERGLSEVLCPNLQHLEFLGLHSTHDAVLFVFILYRLRLYEYASTRYQQECSEPVNDNKEPSVTRPQPLIKPLTVIRFGFSRNKKEGNRLEKSIRKLAKVTGVKLRVVRLDYPEDRHPIPASRVDARTRLMGTL